MSPRPDPLPAPKLGEPYLLTPGPLTTAYEVKQAMLRDWGSWDADFRAMTKSVLDQLVALAGDTTGEFACVPMQGSGSFSVEAMLGTFVPRDGKVLVLANGAYGLRAARDDALSRPRLYLDRQGRLHAAARRRGRGRPRRRSRDHPCDRDPLRDIESAS